MLKSLPFEGTIKVRNKGVDAAILADRDTVDLAFAASRKLVVCGVSTAVLEVTCFSPVDTRTLRYYMETTPCLLAMTQMIYDTVKPYLSETDTLVVFFGTGEDELIQAVRQMRQRQFSVGLQ